MPPKKDHIDNGRVSWDPFNSTPTPTTTPNKPRATQQKDDFPALAEGSKSKNTNNNVLQPNANPKVNTKLNPTASVWIPKAKLSANPDYDGLPVPTKHAWDTKPPAPHIFKDGTPINPPNNKSAATSRPEGTGTTHGALPIHTKPENINPTGPSAKTISASQPSSELQRVNHKLAAYVDRVSHDTLTYPFVKMDAPLWEAPCFVYTSLERSKLGTYLNPATIKRMKTAGHWIGKDGSYVNGKLKYDRYVSGLEEGMQQEQEQADEINRIQQEGSIFEMNCEHADWGWFRERDPHYAVQQGGAGGNGGGNGGGNDGGNGGGNGGGGGGRGGGAGRGGASDRGDRGGRGGSGGHGGGRGGH